jgi:membrane carboxypeptidase/penicillin-binding protein
LPSARAQQSPAVEEAAASLRPNLGRIAGLVGGICSRAGQQSTTGRLTGALFRTD